MISLLLSHNIFNDNRSILIYRNKKNMFKQKTKILVSKDHLEKYYQYLDCIFELKRRVLFILNRLSSLYIHFHYYRFFLINLLYLTHITYWYYMIYIIYLIYLTCLIWHFSTNLEKIDPTAAMMIFNKFFCYNIYTHVCIYVYMQQNKI